jgi:hypothetical protein
VSEEKPDKGEGADMAKVAEGEIPAGLRRVYQKLEHILPENGTERPRAYESPAFMPRWMSNRNNQVK